MNVFADRRKTLLERLDGALVLQAAPEAVRNNGVHHEYRQHSDVHYLTGFDEPGSVLVVSPKHPEHKFVLFIRKRDPETEVYDGPRPTPEQAKEKYGVDASYTINQFDEKIVEYLTGHQRIYYDLGTNRAFDERILRAIGAVRGKGRRANKVWPSEVVEVERSGLHDMRLVKSDVELAIMRTAASITREAHMAAMQKAAPGLYEYEIDAIIRAIFMHRGSARVAYTPIVASGPNATILHYHGSRRRMEAGELLLIDAGCEYEFYASDVTRTFPVSGAFSAAQRRIYDIVLAAQMACIDAVKPGTNVDAIHQIALKIMIQGLLEEKLLTGSFDEIIEKETYKRYCPHRTSHWIGMDVHDVGLYYVNDKPRTLEPGMVFTIEPGIYVAPDDTKVPAEYRGIGVRIEDDILVTASGYENLTAAIPKLPDDIERVCRDAR
ncbi:MAG: aminopeptidase P N-terminal domain-containing protein [Polyangiaceae bacterium]|nr:aminopeptidase P N-terminal domain-containing protein [Polyangiaceae bacterium]